MSTRQRMTIVSTSLGMFMVFLDALIINVALPDLQAQFDVGESGLQAVVTAYSIGMAVTIMWSGTMADLRGRRRVYVVSVAVFAVASASCGLAPSFAVLVAARTVQGLAAGSITVSSLSLVTAAFDEDRQRTFALGIWTGIGSIGTALGPAIGGVLVDGPGWRSVFFVNVPVGVAAIVLSLSFVVESSDPGDRDFDHVGQALFALAVGGFASFVIGAPNWGWLSVPAVGLLLGVVVCAVLFLRHERAVDDPMMDLTLFRDAVYSTGLATLFIMFFVAYGMLLLVTQYFQNLQGYSAMKAGFLTLPFSLGLLFFSPLSGAIVRRVGRRIPVMLALYVQPFAIAAIAVGLDVGVGVIAVALFVSGAADALALTPLTGLSVGAVPQEKSGMASGIMSTQRAVGSTTGYAVLGSILAVYVAANLPHALEPVVPDATTRDQVSASIEEAANPSAYAAELGPARTIVIDARVDRGEVLDEADGVFVRGMQIALALGIVLLVACAVVGRRTFPVDRPAAPARSP